MKPLLGLLANTQLAFDPLELARQAVEQAASANAPARQAGADPAAPRSPTSGAPRKGKKPSGWAIADRVLGGGETFTQARRSEEALIADQEAKVQRATELQRQLQIVREQFPNDPMAEITFLTNPEKFAENYSERYGQDVVAGGSSVRVDGKFETAPRVEQFGDRFGVANVQDGQLSTQFSQPRDPTFAEMSEDRARQRTNIPDGAEVADFGPTGGPGGFDAFYENHLAPAEGGFVARDGKGGAPANFGINQAANPDVDVSRLTREDAKRLAYERYWKPSGADQLPPGLAEVHADTAFNMGLGAASQMLEQSGGDAQRYLQLREERYRALAQDPGHAPNLGGWLERNNRLAQYIGGGPGGQAPSGAPRIVASNPKDAPPPAPQFREASPEEVRARGLEGRFQISPNGEWKPFAGGDAADKRAKAQEAQAAQATRIIGTTREARSNINATTSGLIGKAASGIPGTPAYDLARKLETIKANLGFQELAAMRAASPTGGALGQVAVQELMALQSTVENLDIGQSPDQLRANLQKIEQHYQAWLDATNGQGRWRAPEGPPRAGGVASAPRKPAAEKPASKPAATANAPRKAAAPKVGAVVKGYRYKGGDPAKPSSWEKV
jgi:hypothetical protein